MKQLAIYCSDDLRETVVRALDHALVDGFLLVPDCLGHYFARPGDVPRTISWEASVILVPAADEDRIARVVDELRAHAGRCEIEPCLRIVVSPVERVL